MKRPKSLLAACAPVMALLLASCFSPRAATIETANIADPNQFGRNLFHIAQSGSARDWGTQLTAERRKMGDEYAIKHFTAWRPILVELNQTFGGTTDSTEFRLQENGLEFLFDKKWTLLIRVANEDGGLKINQD